MNDTGCTLQTLFSADLTALGYSPLTYWGHRGTADITTGNGGIRRRVIVIETQITKADGTAITPWFTEDAMILPLQSGVQYRLSGSETRNHLFFATAPGNANLFVAQKKSGIVTQLPVV